MKWFITAYYPGIHNSTGLMQNRNRNERNRQVRVHQLNLTMIQHRYMCTCVLAMLCRVQCVWNFCVCGTIGCKGLPQSKEVGISSLLSRVIYLNFRRYVYYSAVQCQHCNMHAKPCCISQIVMVHNIHDDFSHIKHVTA